jgi:uncharacterized paraquat-inducible protein A
MWPINGYEQQRTSEMKKAELRDLPNYACPSPDCGVPLQVVRIKSQPRAREDVFCPRCMTRLAPRDGDDSLQYRLVKKRA